MLFIIDDFRIIFDAVRWYRDFYQNDQRIFIIQVVKYYEFIGYILIWEVNMLEG